MNANPHHWRFFRAGGFEQARIDDGADVLAIDTLDPKLWVALSCPTKGIEEDTHAGLAARIAAAFTAGDADQLMVGRNGVFYDRRGRDHHENRRSPDQP